MRSEDPGLHLGFFRRLSAWSPPPGSRHVNLTFDAEQIRDAERIARSTDGVKGVSNQLSVDTTQRTVKDSFEDAWIVVMINSKMGVDPEVRSRNVDVDVHEGVVTLSGIV